MSGKLPELIGLPEDIIFDVAIKKGWANLDLMKYNLLFEDMGKLGITIQWMSSVTESGNSRFFSFPITPNPLTHAMYRQKGEAVWTFPKGSISFYVKADRYR